MQTSCQASPIGQNDHDLMKVPEVRSCLRLNQDDTLRRLIKAGKLRAFRVGRTLLIPRSALDAYLRNAST